MAPPANTSFLLATNIAAFPFTLTQSDINDAGVNFTVYYKFTAPANSKVIGAWGFSGNIGAGYRPTIKPYNGPAGAPTQILSIANQNMPIQFPVVAGNEYFLEFVKNVNTAGPEHIDISVIVAPTDDVVLGDIAVNDDSQGYPLIIQSPSINFETRRFYTDIASSDEGNILYPSSEILIHDTVTGELRLYDTDFNLLNTYVDTRIGQMHLSANIDTNKWYIGSSGGGPDSVAFTTMVAGILSGYTILAVGAGMTCLAANNDDTILYWQGFGGSVNTPVKRWNIPGGVALADFAAGIANYQNEDIIVLEDDTILISYFKSTVVRDFNVKRYNAAGAVLNTYNFGSVSSSIAPKITRALDSPNSFWAWTQNVSGGASISTFQNVRVSDGVVLATVTHGMYITGSYSGNETATPSARFGNSDSCTFFIMVAAAVDDFSGIYVMVPDKTDDTLFTDDTTTLDVKIPNPLAQLYLSNDGS